MFLVGNIYVQPQEYAAVATKTTVSGELTTVTTPTGIYAPVATHPSSTTTVIKPKFKKFELSENSHSKRVVAHSNSPASSCSTHTPTTSRC